jgi:hypothetical protein
MVAHAWAKLLASIKLFGASSIEKIGVPGA